MLYYRLNDVKNGSVLFMKPSEARIFLNLEDEALKAYADMGEQFGGYVISRITAQQAEREREALEAERMRKAAVSRRSEYIAKHGPSIWCGYLLFAAKFLNRMPAAVSSDVNIRTFRNAAMSGITMPCVTVYASPSDYPGWYVARLFDHGHPLNVHIRRRTVEEIRADIIRRFPGMIPFAPGADDEPCIVEIWL